MEHENYQEKKTYSFGVVYYYPDYVIGKMNNDTVVNTAVATTILTDINNHYKSKKIVYISNREMSNDTDLAVYDLVDSKKMIGIAVVSTHEAEQKQAAKEQKLYHGSFGFFNKMSSAVAWAELLISDNK